MPCPHSFPCLLDVGCYQFLEQTSPAHDLHRAGVPQALMLIASLTTRGRHHFVLSLFWWRNWGLERSSNFAPSSWVGELSSLSSRAQALKQTGSALLPKVDWVDGGIGCVISLKSASPPLFSAAYQTPITKLVPILFISVVGLRS